MYTKSISIHTLKTESYYFQFTQKGLSSHTFYQTCTSQAGLDTLGKKATSSGTLAADTRQPGSREAAEIQHIWQPVACSYRHGERRQPCIAGCCLHNTTDGLGQRGMISPTSDSAGCDFPAMPEVLANTSIVYIHGVGQEIPQLNCRPPPTHTPSLPLQQQ